MKNNNCKQTNKEFWLVILLGALTAFDPLTIDMYLPAFINMQNDLKTSISSIELSVSLFFIGMALGQLVYGPLSDKYGRKNPLLGGMFLYFLATIGCALANHISHFIVFRILQAFGGCASMVISRAIIRDLFEKRQIAIILSNMALVMGIAPIVAPSIGAFINQFFGWRFIFYFLALANFLCIILIILFLPETNFHKNNTLSLKAVTLKYFHFIREREFIGYLIPDVAVRAGMFAYIAGSPFVFIELFHLNQKEYGMVFGLNGLGLLIAAQINKLLLKKFSPESICSLSIKIASLSSMSVLFFSIIYCSIIGIFISLFVFISSLNFISPNSIAIVLSQQNQHAGSASAFYGCFQWSAAFFTSLLVSSFHNGSAIPMTATIFLCGLVSLIGFQFLIQFRKLNYL